MTDTPEHKAIASADAVKNYNHVVKCANLDHVRLLDVKFAVKPEFYSEGPPSLSYKISVENDVVDQDTETAFAFVKVGVSAKKGRKQALSCNGLYLIGYSGFHDCEPEAIKMFLQRVAPFAVYPYFRALFANLDWSAGINLPPLPVHREAETEVVPNPAQGSAKKKRTTSQGK